MRRGLGGGELGLGSTGNAGDVVESAGFVGRDGELASNSWDGESTCIELSGVGLGGEDSACRFGLRRIGVSSVALSVTVEETVLPG